MSRAYGRDADEFAADQPGDVRAVAVVVVRRDSVDAALREVVEGRDAIAEVDARLRCRSRSRRRQCRVPEYVELLKLV